jgi:hypothetical protein
MRWLSVRSTSCQRSAVMITNFQWQHCPSYQCGRWAKLTLVSCVAFKRVHERKLIAAGSTSVVAVIQCAVTKGRSEVGIAFHSQVFPGPKMSSTRRSADLETMRYVQLPSSPPSSMPVPTIPSASSSSEAGLSVWWCFASSPLARRHTTRSVVVSASTSSSAISEITTPTEPVFPASSTAIWARWRSSAGCRQRWRRSWHAAVRERR